MKKMSSKKNILLIGSRDDCPDLEYATGFKAIDPVVFLQLGRKKILIVPGLEYGRAKQESPHSHIYTSSMLKIDKKDKGSWSGQIAAVLKEHGVHSVVVSPNFYLDVARRLEKKGIRVHVSGEPLYPQRAVKSMEEIKKISEAQQAAVIAMRSAITMISAAEIDDTGFLRVRGKHLTSEAVREAIRKVMLEHKCIGREVIVAGGLQAADPHNQGTGNLRAYEAIVLDIFPKHIDNGYWGDLTRTVVRGTASPRLRRMYNAVKSAHAKALAKVKAGVKTSVVHREAVDELVRKGFKNKTIDGKPSGFIHSVGHGVGLSIHESPSVGNNQERLKSGQVITIEPGLYYPDIGGVRIEDTVVVTNDGWKYLVPCEKKFEI